MLKNYLKIGWRNILKNRFYSLVNIIGLSSGIAFAILIGAYIWCELQVNTKLKDADNQYIIQSKWKNPNMGFEITTLGPLAKTLKEEYPNLIANYYRIDAISSIVSKGDKHFRENIQIGDNTILNMYGFSLLQGDTKTAFTDPYSVVITEEMAIKYFGKVDVLGQTLTIENFSGSKHDFIISGIMKKLSQNSVTMFDNNNNQIFLPLNSQSFFGRDITPWTNPYIISYVELQEGVGPEDINKPMRKIINSNAPSQISSNITPYLVPLKKYYLDANNGLVRKMINALMYVVIFILLMAIINFINLSISQSGSRLKEIGVRKVLGGMKKQLIFQFLIESIIIVFLATFFAVFIYEVTRNYFGSILGKNIPELTSFPLYFAFLILALSIIVGSLSGFYPAFVLSSLKSVDSLKGKLATIKEKTWLRKLLMGFQFSIAAIVSASAIIISQQVSFFFSKNLGYNKDYVITAQVPRDWSQQGVSRMETIRDELTHLNIVSSVSLSYEIPNGNNNGSNNMYKPGHDSSEGVTVQSLVTDERFADTYQIPIVTGQYLNNSFNQLSDIVINETAAKAFNWTPSEAIGKEVKVSDFPTTFTIVGVIKDFHFGSMQENIQPTWFMNVSNRQIYRYLSIRVTNVDVNNAVETLQKEWSKLIPGAPFEYKFMDDILRKIYETDIQFRKASYAATLLAIIIALLGVIGLISLSIQRRTKEIAIRKILGSSMTGIIKLFVKEFLFVILFASILACPFAYLIMQNWLNGYAYKIAVTAEPFIMSVSFLILITILLIIIQTIKTANENPVKNLKTE